MFDKGSSNTRSSMMIGKCFSKDQPPKENPSQKFHKAYGSLTSALERATVFCFLLFQETTFPPIDLQKPVVDRLSMGDPA
ncbi:hypothetical protein CR513_47921, partial [Mucuna pruriens]